MRHRAFRLAPALAAAMLLIVPALASAQADVASLTNAINTTWVVIAAVLVLFMQAGFAMLETGLSRMKNAGAVMAKVFVNLSVALVMFWAVGFALGFGDGNSFVGWSGWFLPSGDIEGTFSWFSAAGLDIEVIFLFQAAFVAVSLAIVFGSMLDRTKFVAYIAFGIVFAGLIYPIVAHWSFGGGWLFQDGFLDFAGSSVVHLQGAVAATIGAIILGPRIGKFRDGRAVPIPGHSMPLALLGVLILAFGWAGFNGGSFLAVVGVNIGSIITNTYLAAGAGVLGAIIGSILMFKTLDVSQIGNGAIAGLVAITAPCFFVDPWAALVIGLVAGLIVPPIVVAVERMKIDDPIGAIPVHGIAGIWGTLAIGLFATAERATPILELAGIAPREGLLVGGDASQLWVQFYGVAVTVAFTGVASAVLFLAIKHTVGLRVSEEQELRGLDISEHGMFGYPERFIDVAGATPEDLPVVPTPLPPSAAATRPATASR
jgi:ammonium transporter, Amt family